jgi:hypothetical protein
MRRKIREETGQRRETEHVDVRGAAGMVDAQAANFNLPIASPYESA